MPRKSPVRIAATSLLLICAVAPLRSQQQQQQPPPSQNPPPQNPAPSQTPASPSAPGPAAPASAKPAAPGTPAAPATPPAAGTISSQVKLVTLYATVHDKKGKLINNLNQDNFTVQEDGRPQTIKYFARDPDVPLLLGLLVDTSLSQRHVIGAERTASGAFIDHMVGTKDKACVLHFDREVELLEDLTNSRDKLRAALQELQVGSRDDDDNSSGGSNGGGRGGGGWPGGGGSGGGGRGGSGGSYHHGGTLLYDAIYLSANEIMKKQQGRKAVVVLTDGNDRGSKVSLSEAIEAAQRADMLVYSVLFTDPDAPRQGGYSSSGNQGPWGGGGGRRGGQSRYPQQDQRPDGKKILERIARETGGRMFEVNKKQSVDDIYTELEQELRNQYSLAYTPAGTDSGKYYHMLSVSTNQKDLVVQSREGYYSEK